MRRAYRDVHQRVWWILGPALLVAVFYAAWFPARLPVAEPPPALAGEAP